MNIVCYVHTVASLAAQAASGCVDLYSKNPDGYKTFTCLWSRGGQHMSPTHVTLSVGTQIKLHELVSEIIAAKQNGVNNSANYRLMHW